jgi:hypothetical protein
MAHLLQKFLHPSGHPKKYDRLEYNYPGQYNRNQPFMAPSGISQQYSGIFLGFNHNFGDFFIDPL